MEPLTETNPVPMGMLRLKSYYVPAEVGREADACDIERSLPGVAAQAQAAYLTPLFEGHLHLGIAPALAACHDAELFFPLNPDNPAENFRLLIALLPDAFNGWSAPSALIETEDDEYTETFYDLYWAISGLYPALMGKHRKRIHTMTDSFEIAYVEGTVEGYEERPQTEFTQADALAFAATARSLGAQVDP